MSNTTNEMDTAAPEKQQDGTFAPSLTKRDLNQCARRWCIGNLAGAYDRGLAPCLIYAITPALRKIYRNDEEGFKKSFENTWSYFNITPHVCGLLMGACLAIEDREHANGIEAAQGLKTGLMGSISGVGDTVFFILLPTIMGSIAAYMGQQGNPTGALIWLAIMLALFVFKLTFWNIGYRFGTALITTLAEKIGAFTEAISILGLTVVGALIPTTVKLQLGLSFALGDVTMSVQENVLDAIVLGILPVCATAIVYALVKRGVKLVPIIIGIVVISCIGAAFDIFAA